MSLTTKVPSPQEEFRRIEKHYPQLSSTGCTRSFCQSGRMVHTDEQRVGIDCQNSETVESEAVDFLQQLRRDGIIKSDTALAERVQSVLNELRSNVVQPPHTNGHGTKPPSEHTSGVWDQSTTELEHGVRLSWKHARKCIMRSEYNNLRYFIIDSSSKSWFHGKTDFIHHSLRDLRHLTTSKEMGQALLEGMHQAFNGGDIDPSGMINPQN